MSGVRNFTLPLYFCLVVVSLLLFLNQSIFASELSSTWTAKYTNLNDDLRVVAIDPLNPQLIYVGSDKGIVSSSDGGATWGLLHSFMTDKLDLSRLKSDAGLESIIFIQEGEVKPGTTIIKAAGEEAPSAAPAESGAAEGTALQSEEVKVKLEKAQEDHAQAEDAAAAARARAKAFPPDELTVSEVESLEVTDSGYMEPVNFDRLKAWLSDRGLAVPASGTEGTEGQETLIEYLKQQKAKAAVLQVAEGEAAAAEADAQKVMDSLAEQLEKAQTEQQQATAALAARSESQAAKSSQESGLDEEPAGTPSPVIGSISGVTFIAIDPSNTDRIFSATFDGLYLSTDKGENWEMVYRGTGDTESAVISLAIDPSNPETIYAGTLNGLNKSLDGGKTWQSPQGRINNEVINYIAVHPFDSQIVLAATQKDGIFKSSDGGVTWTQVYSVAGANDVYTVAFAAASPETIYAGTEAGIYRSKDGGDTWDNITGLGLSNPLIQYLLVSPIDENTAYVAALGGVYGTTDQGKQWRKVTYGTIFRKPKFMTVDPLDSSSIFLLTRNRLFQSEPLALQDLSEGKKEIAGNCEFTVAGEKHSLIIRDLDPETEIITIEVRSDPRIIKLKVGAVEQVDLDQDGKEDITITAEEIEDGVPHLTLESLAAPAPEPVAVSTSPAEINGLEDLQPYFQAEPSWTEVQAAASRWAEVHPDKIAGWRRGASLRAFLPRVRFAYTKTRDWYDDTYSTADGYQKTGESGYSQRSSEVNSSGGSLFTTQYSDGTYQWYDEYSSYSENSYYNKDSEGNEGRDSTGNRYKERHKSRNSKSWHVEFTWYLGDFLYERQQLYISREARDLVELRQDVLEQINQYYFDRQSARIDMILNPPADSYSKVEALLRIQQLNASLDALTGGYFSRYIKEKSRSLE